ncbi:protein-tyrosine phosphatase-like protein [Trametes maxima]|nr:protein-tyrosine phosphatase-like protein [Trametes maxima]
MAPVAVLEVRPTINSDLRQLPTNPRSAPSADALVSMLRSMTVDDGAHHRSALRKLCTQRTSKGEFPPQASEILPNLFLADMYTATSPAALAQLRATHVVSVVQTPPYRYEKPTAHLCVPVEDNADANLLDFLDCAVRWIHDALAGGGRVLVHCVWGMSRSATVVAAYLVAARKMALADALVHIRARRPIVRPNAGFMQQLVFFARVTRLRESHAQRLAKEAEEEGEDLDVDALARRVGVCGLPELCWAGWGTAEARAGRFKRVYFFLR